MRTLFIDDSWFRDIATFAHRTTWLHGPAQFVTTASIVVLGLIALGLWWAARSRNDRTAMIAVIWLGLGTVLSVVASYGLKQVFQETRPCRTLNVATVEACPGIHDYAFPSNHTTIAFAIAAGIFLINRRWGWFALAVAAIEGGSRIYVGAHYPHDVLAGAALSCLIVWGGWRLAKKPIAGLAEALAKTPVRHLMVTR